MPASANHPGLNAQDEMALTAYKVLVIDDYEPIRREVQWCLEGLYGVTVLTAADGQSGLDMMVEHQPSLVILDLMMPVMDGFEVLRKRKLIDPISEIPIVVLTAQETADNLIARVLLAGATDYLRKPIDTHDLRQYIAARVALAESQSAENERKRRLRHNMGNPLTVIIALAEMLQSPDTNTNPEKVAELAEQISSAGERLHGVIDQLLSG